MPIGGYDKRLGGSGQAWRSGPSAPSKPSKVAGQGPRPPQDGHLADHPASRSEGLTASKGAAAAAVEEAIEAYCADNDSAEDNGGRGRVPLFRRLDCAGRETDDLRSLTATEETPERQYAVEQALAYLSSGEFEEDILEHLAHHGTEVHPYASAPLAWDLQIARIREELDTFRKCGLGCCAGSFKDLVVDIALGGEQTSADREERLARVKAHLDQPRVWAAMVRNANRQKLADFACPDIDGYVGHLQHCVDTWYRNLLADGNAGDIDAEDIAWLKSEFGRLALATDPPHLEDRIHLHEDYETLLEATSNLQDAFRKDAEWFMVSGGAFHQRRRRAGQMIREGRQVTDRNIADWHDSHFAAAIRRFKAARAAAKDA